MGNVWKIYIFLKFWLLLIKIKTAYCLEKKQTKIYLENCDFIKPSLAYIYAF